MKQSADAPPPGVSALHTLRRSALALAVGYCVALVACQEPASEVCASGRFCPAGSHCGARQDVCIFTPCGNAKVDGGEVCDDGNLLDGDGCNSTCTSAEVCGNGIKDVKEECDWALTPQNCTSECKSNVCGNGDLNIGEECDPGFQGTTEQCLANCRWSRHGDGWVNPLHDGEQCDGDGVGSTSGGAYGPDCEFAGTVNGAWLVCNASCKLGRHGDGVVNRSDGEVCDGLSNGVPTGRADCESAVCNWNCSWTSCGDHVVNATAGEVCDDGNRDNFDDCTNACTTNACGDGIKQVRGSRVEQCDDGSDNVATNAGRTCGYNQTCTFCLAGSCTVAAVVGPHCGDGIVQTGNGEQCDDDRSRECGTCNATCTKVLKSEAQGTIEVVAVGSIVAGDAIFIADGVSTMAAVLEFSDSAGNCTTTAHACVNMLGVGTSDAAATQLRNAMTQAGWTSLVTPQWSLSPNPITLQHQYKGIVNDIPITVQGASVAVAPAQGAVVVEGMSGGAGCIRTQACGENRDCVSGLACVNHVCN